MHTWLPIHVEIPAEHPVVYANYACPNLFIVNYMYQAYEQTNKVLQGHWERMTICQYRFHSIIHVHSRCFSLRQTFETVHMFVFIMTGMGNPFLTTVSKLITLDTPGACISCVLFPNLWSWPSPPRNITTPLSDTTTTIPHQTGTFQVVALPHPNNFEVVSQPVSLGSDIALNFNEPSRDCLLVNVTAL